MTLYKIGDICDLLTITPRTIRYYDQLGLLPNIKRSDGYTRLFDQHDIDTITSIRHLQKSQSLPLSSIKERLFPKNLIGKNVILITDSFSQKLLPLSSDLTIIPFDETTTRANQSKQLYQFLHSNQNKSTIYICFFHESLSPAYASIAKKFPDNSYFLYPLKHYGMSHYMISHYIYSNLSHFSNLEELHLVINRLITRGFSLCFLDSLNTYVSVQDQFKSHHDFLNCATDYHPVILSTNTSQSTVSFYANALDKVSDITIMIDTLLHKQKRYVQEACIFYSHSNHFANALKQELANHCPNFSCSISKINNWPYTDNQVNFISII